MNNFSNIGISASVERINPFVLNRWETSKKFQSLNSDGIKIPKVLKLLEFPCFDALSYSHLAEGKIDIVLQCGNKIWDIHPLIPIIEAAGGKVSTWNGDEAKKGGNIIVANNEKNKKQMIKLLKPAI